MNRKGLYKFTDKSPAQPLLYLDDKGTKDEKDDQWIVIPKVKPSTDMIIFYEED